MQIKKIITTVSIGILSLSLFACSAKQEEKPASNKSEKNQSESKENKSNETDKKTEEKNTSAKILTSWSANPADLGEEIGSASDGSWQVQVFQVATGKSTSDSSFVHPDTGENILPEGSDIAFLNFVYTNIGNEPITLGFGALGRPTVKNNSEFGTDYATSAETEALKKLGQSNRIIKEGLPSDTPLIVKPGESYAAATHVAYKSGDKLNSLIRFVPVKPGTKSDLDHDKSQEVKVEFVLK